MSDDAQAKRDLDMAYASVQIPDLVWDDMKRESCFYESTAIATGAGPIDPYETLFREGKRAAVMTLERKIVAAKRTRHEEQQTKAVSSTAERIS